MLRTHENSDVFNTLNEIYLVFTSKKKMSSIYHFYCQRKQSEISSYPYTYKLAMLGRGAVPVPQKHVRYKTWNGISMTLPTSTPPRHIQSCSMFCCTLLYVHPSIAINLVGKRELVALLNLSSWCLVMVERLFLAVPRSFLMFVIVVFPDHTHYFSLCAISTQISNSGPNIANPPRPPPSPHTHESSLHLFLNLCWKVNIWTVYGFGCSSQCSGFGCSV